MERWAEHAKLGRFASAIATTMSQCVCIGMKFAASVQVTAPRRVAKGSHILDAVLLRKVWFVSFRRGELWGGGGGVGVEAMGVGGGACHAGLEVDRTARLIVCELLLVRAHLTLDKEENSPSRRPHPTSVSFITTAIYIYIALYIIYICIY